MIKGGNWMITTDLVIRGNAIFTATQHTLFKGSIAITKDRIVGIGTDEQIRPLIGETTQIIDAGDGLVLPGFHDFHLHLWLGCLYQEYCNLTECYSEEETALKVAEFSKENPEDPWVLGFGWHHLRWENEQLPSRHTLDRYIDDRPVFLLNGEAHSAWLNSKALEILGINEETVDPPFGKIERDEKGFPTGFLYETAMKLAIKALDIPVHKKEKLMDNFQKKALSLGITSISDMLPLPGFELGDPDWYAKYEASEKLNVRIHFLITLDGNLERAKYMRDHFHSDKLMFSGLKQFIDGVPLTYTGYLLEPYADDPTKIGGTLLEQKLYQKWITEADKEGFRIRLHACGDGAVRLGLDFFEKAQETNGVRDSRHTIEHIEVIHPDDLSRFDQLQVIASVQPEHMAATSVESHPYINRLGLERCKYTWAFGSLQRQGAQLIFGSDYPVVELNPLLEIYRAITRKQLDGTPIEGWHPTEKISLSDALTYYTQAPAYGNFRESDLGTLEIGKKADIVIMDRNLFTTDIDDLLMAKVDITIMDGKIVYKR